MSSSCRASQTLTRSPASSPKA